ncbi:hypothetical protein [Streptomyces fumanus]|uniref:hypothetical protein n=1 Tax=Streptomyces fumanus TaxID=67302 RepID=UPI0033D15E80
MISIQLRNGKVHAAQDVDGFQPFPKCGGNRATERYIKVAGDVNCKNCLKIVSAELSAEIERLEAKAKESAIISEAATADDNKGETMAENTTTEAPKLDVNTDAGKAALEQIQANIERAKVLATEDNAEALEELGRETEAIISNLSGKGSIKAKKENRDAWKAAVEAAAKPKKAAPAKPAENLPAKTWDQYAGTVELANMSVEKITEGVRAHLKVSHLAKDIAAATLDIWLRLPNKADAPDLMGDSDAAKKASRAIYEKATEGLEDTYDNREALKKLIRSAQDQRSDVRAEWLRSLDEDTPLGAERREIMAKVLEGKPEDEKASEWVANVYGTSTMGQTEKRRLEYQAKKALAAADGNASGASAEGEDSGDGDADGADQAEDKSTPADPDEYLTKTVDRVYKDLNRTDRDEWARAAEKASADRKKAERQRLEKVLDAVRDMIAATL